MGRCMQIRETENQNNDNLAIKQYFRLKGTSFLIKNFYWATISCTVCWFLGDLSAKENVVNY